MILRLVDLHNGEWDGYEDVEGKVFQSGSGSIAAEGSTLGRLSDIGTQKAFIVQSVVEDISNMSDVTVSADIIDDHVGSCTLSLIMGGTREEAHKQQSSERQESRQ
ncbi:hypothetical protein XA68_13756 [Ophiocordyceps unilateralis]|uniref:Uncharacterized protein n=1 Tax=Ophiocordyceps unilateralis TaxID=268505 RepID=A0A2A9PBJ3_OPHUN|nr:hypothetical protein XA68_13756 [Ophiocordyceps unilateralis]